MVIGGVFSQSQLVRATFNSDTAVTIQADAIEDGTLIVGTHLIYLQVLNDEIYQIALESASQSGQSQIYYKSELGGGNWYDITSASGLSAITEEGTIVDKAEIEALPMTHHTKADGITYELRFNMPICMFDIYPAYDLEQMQELEPLKLNYDLLKESGSKSKSDKRNIELLKTFFAINTHTSETNQYDGMIKALQLYYQQLSENNAPAAETEVVLKVMGKLDAARKAIVCNLVATELELLMDKLADVSSEDEEAVYEMNDSLLTACGNSQGNLSESQIEYEGNQFSEGATKMTKLEYYLAVELISDALQNNYAQCDDKVAKLIHLYHIMDGMIVNASEEILILNELIEVAEDTYKEALASGESPEYQQAKANNSSHALLERILADDAEKVNVLKNELQFYIRFRRVLCYNPPRCHPTTRVHNHR